MQIDTSTKKNSNKMSQKKHFKPSNDMNDDDSALIEAVPYEDNQELLRAFGQPVGSQVVATHG